MNRARARVPGKIMLAGEYAVLRGAPALASTIQAFVTVNVTPTDCDGLVRVRSSLWNDDVVLDPRDGARLSTSIPDSHRVLADAARVACQTYDCRDATIDVDSSIDLSWGAGSSSALRLGVFAAVRSARGHHFDRSRVAREAFETQRALQGRASGYDVATQALATDSCSIVRFQSRPETAIDRWPEIAGPLSETICRRLPCLVQAFVGGRGAPTMTQIRSMSDWLDHQGLWDTFLDRQTRLVDTMERALAGNDSGLYATVGAARSLMTDAPGFPTTVHHVLRALPEMDSSWSWKTTGAGGEDAILLFGIEASRAAAAAALITNGWTPLPVAFGGAMILDQPSTMDHLKTSGGSRRHVP